MYLKHLLHNRDLRIFLSVPVFSLIVVLLCLCVKPLSIYVFNCYFEVLAVTVAWVALWGFIFMMRRLRNAHPLNSAIALALVVATLSISFPYAMNVAKGRYLFYKRGLYALSHKDVNCIKSAITAFQEKDWELVKSCLYGCSDAAFDFFSYSTGKIFKELRRLEMSQSKLDYILDNCQVTPSIYELYKSFAVDYDGDYREGVKMMTSVLLGEINKIDELYKAISQKDVECCLELISSHGYYWFEPAIMEMLQDSDDCISILEKIVIKDDGGEQYKMNLKYAWGL